jgi:hypothetical protein
MAALEQLASDYGVTLDEATLRHVAEQVQVNAAVREGARRLVREGAANMPPDWWEPLKPRRNAGSPLAERNRLALWDIRVQMEAGKFLTWCEQAGIRRDGPRLAFPERLRYPPQHDYEASVLPDLDWNAEDEHKAALGAFWLWWLSEDELSTVGAGADRDPPR